MEPPAEHKLLSEHALLIPDASRRSSGYHAWKRALDIVGSTALILILLPILPFIVLAIWVDSGRPIIYSQPRVRSRRVRVGDGWAWRLESFTFYKFRTMHDGANPTTHRQYMEAYINGDEGKLAELRPSHQDGPSYKLSEDSRITRVGRVLRSTSVDELPQLWNVLLGHMSLVGPRPPIPYEVRMYRPQDMARFAAKPGITGLWQVSGRSELSFDSMVALDVDYIHRQSILLDLSILVRTLPAVISGKGAG
ncbi:MAG: sugar transferase [Actinomycetota bacterium]